MNPFKDKSVCVVGNGKDRNYLTTLDVYVFCNRISLVYPPQRKKHIIFWDSCENFDSDKHGIIKYTDFVYIYALREDTKELIKYLKSKHISHATYCPACRNEHEDNTDINGIHWALPLTNHLQGRPFTGFLAIYKALIDGAKKIYVTGFDLYREPNGWRSFVGPHNIQRHADWLWNHSTEVDPSYRIEMMPDTFKAVKECREFFANVKEL